MTEYLTQRNGIYYYMRRVPEHVAKLDKRKFVRTTLKTRNHQEGLRKALIHNDYMEEYWRTLLKDNQKDPASEYKLAVKLAKIHNYTYRSITEVVQRPIQNITSRIDTAYNSIENPETVSAVLGGLEQPQVLLRDCLNKYWSLCADRLTKKSEHQVTKWKNPRKAAFDQFTAINDGSTAVQGLQRSHVIKYWDSLNQRITKQEIVGNTANKSLGYVRDILIAIATHYEIDINFKRLFSELKFKDKKRSRPSFDASYVQNTYLRGNSLMGMNTEARMLLYAMADTGARDSEIIGLRKEDIILSEDIPYIWIRPYEGHSLKTEESARKIPLAGASLFAFQNLPDGFHRYKSADSASSAVNKYLRENELKPSPLHCLYSLRHTFKDRLRDIGANDEIIDELMGHKSNGPKYGRGHLLEKKYEWLKKIAYTPPLE